ncbi:uncharacterized protein LOC107824108 [Nicotiana tabacum]|uniref:DUF7642 domain-containing protein n=2 Tax=Nicotiana TaxID=4085 RepID=A0A1S4CYW8_TOBAC|nr:PREDICTED: uncharacterized protein LOC104217788 isoform X1 [Nicotiana sylvestris]XP_009766414.1 PREDICTED: uncharacterized protein LOC104217788 isoform X1 [Nicotiana sylvestris]XP_009766415.1 PREDICTED: uncharacterized protein LOC104217788 isoform X1 [Nicotiana sylvestris]XP_016506321.1 PREDICTED: uncharacterized protein LOC107824108 [Nicotiana tabacum]XP_016506323.1 PREDICTED: uncharacterized protein LOC107824108 [Nicotiana tabacum]XP_016506324.1 PREDICTED: uncharacterized protein LOC10782
MESKDRVGEIDRLERGLLVEHVSEEESEEEVVYTASFEEAEDYFVKYQTARWVLYSFLLILAWGIGLIMLLYLPLRRYILRKDIRSRKLYLTPNAIVYKVTKPVPFPCFGDLKKEKYVLLPSVADIIVEQGYLQSLCGVYSVRIENVGVRRSPSDDLQIQGIADPLDFRKAVLMRLSNLRSEAFSRQASAVDDTSNLRIGYSSAASMSPSRSIRPDSISHSGDLAVLQKLEEVGSSVKRVQNLIEEHHFQTPEHLA